MSEKVGKQYRNKRVISVCTTCKAKKLKCDKSRPSCSRCLKANKQCNYPLTINNISSVTPPDESTSPNFSRHVAKLSHFTTSDRSRKEKDPVDVKNIHRERYPSSPSSTITLNSTIPNNNSFKTNIHETPLTNEDYSPGCINTDAKINLNLWNPNNLIVTYGSTTYYDSPLASHGLIQYDPYTRLFCGALHGSTLYELQARLTFISSESNDQPGNEDKKEKLGPLHFLEKAIIKWVEKSNEYVKNQLPLDYFNTTYTIEDTMHPNLLASIQMIIREIEIIMINKNHIDYYLRHFYENIYPYYPLIEIPLFEKKLKDILVENQGNHYEFSVFKQNIRVKLETLAMFLLILSISLRSKLISPTVPKEEKDDKIRLDTKNASDIATQLIVFAQKVLSLLNGFKFTNENILCCTLYLFLAEYLNPENRSIAANHDEVLTLNCMSNLANHLGLYNDPVRFERYKNNPDFSYGSVLFKRKLWISLQSIKLQVCTLEGFFTDMDAKYLELFKAPSDGVSAVLNDRFKESSLFDYKLFTIHEDVYSFHSKLGKLMVSISSTEESQDLTAIVDAINELSQLMENKFSFDDLTNITVTSNTIKEDTWRHATMNLDAIKNLYIIHINIIGTVSILGTYSILSTYFEQKIVAEEDNQRWMELYDTFMVKSFETFLKLAEIILNYLDGSYAKYILNAHEFCLNKAIIFTLIRIWRALFSFVLRLSYKKDKMKKSNAEMETNHFNSINKCLFRLKDILSNTADLASAKLGENYIGAYQSLQMVRYLIYTMDEEYLTIMINNYWNKTFNSSSIPERIIEKVNSKWGVGPKNQDLVKNYLANDNVLRNLTPDLIEQVNNLMERSSLNFNDILNDSTPTSVDFPAQNNQDILNQFLEANFDLFSSVINDNMGELPQI
ncbi:regulator of drug sensitivity 1 [Monosporozyma servazzii]